jgi:drug/metabolite transporter (DMT)-like permease
LTPPLTISGLHAAAAPSETRARALSAIVLAGIFIGCAPILVRYSEVGPVATAFWRLSLAVVPLLLLFANSRRIGQAGLVPARASEHFAAALPGFFLAADLSTWHISLLLTSVTNSTLLVNMAPVFVTAGSWLFFRQSVSRVFLVGLVLSIAGIVILRGGASALGGGTLRGDLLALAAAVFYGGYLIFLGRARARFSTSVIMLWGTAAAAACTLPAALVMDRTFFPATATGWAILLALALLMHVSGQGLVTFAMAWLPATFSSLTLLIQPVVAAVLAWMLLGERLDAVQIAGGAVVIVGIVVAKGG